MDEKESSEEDEADSPLTRNTRQAKVLPQIVADTDSAKTGGGDGSSLPMSSTI